MSVFMTKVSFFIFLMFWVRATLPRMRVDRLMNFAWKYMVPLSIVNILAAGVWYECALRPGPPLRIGGTAVPGWLVGWVATLPIDLVAIWAILRINRREREA